MHRATPRLRVFLSLLLLALAAGCDPRPRLVEQHLLEFGTIWQITLIVDDLAAAELRLAEIERRLRAWRQQWHAWEDSDLTRFNAALARGERVPVPASLRALLGASRHYYEATGGLFNPALGELVAAWGFHGGDADPQAIAALRHAPPGMHDLEFDGTTVISRNPRLRLDFGGIAKGYALARIADYLDANGVTDYVVNAGGDLVTAGTRFGKPWRIGIRNPFAPGVIAGLELRGRHSLFTSGNYERRYHRGAGAAHHIIDPRSGEPARGQSSATVLASDPVRADVAATVLMIDGSGKARELALSLGIDDYLVIGEAREITMSASIAEKVRIFTSWPTKIVK